MVKKLKNNKSNLNFVITFIPNFLTAFIEVITSSDISKFFDIETPLPSDENRTHLILKLLSPLT